MALSPNRVGDTRAAFERRRAAAKSSDLQVLAAACAHLRAAPAGQYIRKLCAIWEAITGQLLEGLPAGISGSVALLFDPTLYVTVERTNRDKRWGVAFNFKFQGSPSMYRYFDATPVFVDVLRDTYCLDSDHLEQAIAEVKRILTLHAQR